MRMAATLPRLAFVRRGRGPTVTRLRLLGRWRFSLALAHRPGRRVLLRGGVATWRYSVWFLATRSAEALLVNTHPGFAPRPDYRPLTKFERRGLKLGHGVWDLVFERR